MEFYRVRVPGFLAKMFGMKAHRPRRQSPHTTMSRSAFVAAGNSDLTYSWNTTEYTANQTVYQDLKTLRARARTEYRNNDYVRRFVNLSTDNVVGPDGVDLRAQIMSARGPDKRASRNIEENWTRWGRRGNCDVTGGLSWVEVQRQMWREFEISGEGIARVVRGRGPFGFQLEIIDPARLNERYNDVAENGNIIRMGIEIDKFGAPVAYHLRVKRENDATLNYSYSNGEWYARVQASDIFHLFHPDLATQGRGVPRMAVALLRLQMLSGYEEAALVNARLGASNAMFLTSEYAEDAVPSDGVGADGERYQDIEPGMTRILPPGVTPVEYDPSYPNGEMGEAIKTFLRGAGVGMNVDYPSLSGDLEGVNYSSIRAGVLETREAWKGLQRLFIDAFVRPVYEAWLYEGLLNRAILGANGAPLRMLDHDKYLRVKFAGRRWAWVDPLKEQQAAKTAYEMRAKSLSRIMIEQGLDPEDEWEQMARDKARLDELGLTEAEVMDEVFSDGEDED